MNHKIFSLTFIFIILFNLFSFSSWAADRKIHSSKNSKSTVPTNLDEALLALDKLLPQHEIEKMKESDETHLINYHFGIGMWIRNNWGLWGGSPLWAYFNNLGLFHPDDMSSVILTAYWKHLHNEPFNLENEIKHYREYWLKSFEAGLKPFQSNQYYTEFKHAIKSKSYYLYGAYNYSHKLPNLPEKYALGINDQSITSQCKDSICFISGTANSTISKEHEIWKNNAINYGKNFNTLMIQHIKDNKINFCDHWFESASDLRNKEKIKKIADIQARKEGCGEEVCNLAIASDTSLIKKSNKVIHEYLKLDANGTFLSSAGWAHLKKLTSWEDAPGWASIVYINSYKIDFYGKQSDTFLYKVTYDVLGEETEEKFKENSTQEIQLFKLREIKSHIKIIEPQIPPHIYKKTPST